MRFVVSFVLFLHAALGASETQQQLRGMAVASPQLNEKSEFPDKYLNSSSSCSVYESATCNYNGVMGVCVSKASGMTSSVLSPSLSLPLSFSLSGCCTGSLSSLNLCPGGNDIQCCYNFKCNTPHGAGVCKQTSLCKSEGGVPDSGNYCDGPADLQCCVKGGPTPTPTPTRQVMINRAQDWVNRGIPYSQTAYTGE
jgi:hypothetical protein